MMAVHDGVVEVDEAFAGIIDFCLGCRACEPVCPGLVPYGRMLEGTRAEIVAQVSGRQGGLRQWLLGRVAGWRPIMRLGSVVVSLATRLRLDALAPRRFRMPARGLRPGPRRYPPTVGHLGGSGEAGTVGLLAGCIQDQMFRSVNHAAVTLLEMAGHRVSVPVSQTCCGALAAHDGRAPQARRLAEKNTVAFQGFDLVVATAAGCSAHLAGYGHWASGGDELASAAVDVTVAVSRAIDDGRLPRFDRHLGRIAIQDPCHLRHAQRVVEEPRSILEAAGFEVVEIDDLALCCGAAGIYNLLQPEASHRLGNQKATQIRSTGVSKVASANPGCEMQLRSHLDPEYEIAHPIEWYLKSLRGEGLALGSAGHA
jgi:glycolate oxidase iron-sulfur subunit